MCSDATGRNPSEGGRSSPLQTFLISVKQEKVCFSMPVALKPDKPQRVTFKFCFLTSNYSCFPLIARPPTRRWRQERERNGVNR